MKYDESASVSIPRVMWTYMGDVNSALGENSKESSSSTTSARTWFDENKVLSAMIGKNGI